MNPYRYKISLRIRHPAMDPAEITRAMRLDPWRSWRAGDPRTTPKGRALEGLNRDTYWTARLIEDRWPGKDLASALDECLNRLAPHRDFFHRVRSQGGSVEFFVGWFFDGQSGGLLDSDLLARMADLKINLSLDVYPPDREPDDQS